MSIEDIQEYSEPLPGRLSTAKITEAQITSVDDYTGFELSPGASERLERLVGAAATGLITLAPLICPGSQKCIFATRCPIFQADGHAGQYPVDLQCIVELNLARQKFLDYANELNIKGEVVKNPILRSQVSKLADFDVYEYRLKLILAGAGRNEKGDAISDGSLLLKQVVAVTDMDDEIEQLQEHPAWKVLERLQKQRMDLFDAMGLTEKRKAMIKAALKERTTESFLDRTFGILESLAMAEKRGRSKE